MSNMINAITTGTPGCLFYLQLWVIETMGLCLSNHTWHKSEPQETRIESSRIIYTSNFVQTKLVSRNLFAL